MFHRAMQVKQYVAEIRLKTSWFRVFRTGDPKYYLFSQVNPKTRCDTGLHFPVARKRLRRDVASGLRHGWGLVMEEVILKSKKHKKDENSKPPKNEQLMLF